jgi:hypothetical protein
MQNEYQNNFFKSQTTDDRQLVIVEIESGAEILRESLPEHGEAFKSYLNAKEESMNQAWAKMIDCQDANVHRVYHLAQAAYNVL